jgi:hypothetical protein
MAPLNVRLVDLDQDRHVLQCLKEPCPSLDEQTEVRVLIVEVCVLIVPSYPFGDQGKQDKRGF